MDNAQQFAEKLLQIKALALNLQAPFTWASGWKSPLYCDNRKTLSYPAVRDYVKTELASLIFSEFADAEAIAGVATAGIAHGALAADLLKLPFAYVRGKAKGHGLGNQIEGELAPGSSVVVIEDLISTGKSSLEAVAALQAAGMKVLGVCALFTYSFPQAAQAFEKAGIPWFTISHYQALIQVAKEKQMIQEADLEALESWRQDPSSWNLGT